MKDNGFIFLFAKYAFPIFNNMSVCPYVILSSPLEEVSSHNKQLEVLHNPERSPQGNLAEHVQS